MKRAVNTRAREVVRALPIDVLQMRLVEVPLIRFEKQLSLDFHGLGRTHPRDTCSNSRPDRRTALILDWNVLGLGRTGLAVDAGGNLYVGLPSGIAVFPLGPTKAARMISAGISSPEFFSADAAGGLYVPSQGTRNREVLEFAAGGNHAQSGVKDSNPRSGLRFSPRRMFV